MLLNCSHPERNGQLISALRIRINFHKYEDDDFFAVRDSGLLISIFLNKDMPEIFHCALDSPKDLVKMQIQYKLIVQVHKKNTKAFGVYLILPKFYSIAGLP